MSSLTELAPELADLVRDALPSWNVYDSIPPAAQLPGIVVGSPDSVIPNRTGTLWWVELPLYVLVASTVPDDVMTTMLTATVEVARVVETITTGTNFRSCRLAEIREFFDVQVGPSEARSCSMVLELLIPNPLT